MLEPLQVRYEQASNPGGRLSRQTTVQLLAEPENRSQALLRALREPQPIAQRDDHSPGTLEESEIRYGNTHICKSTQEPGDVIVHPTWVHRVGE